MNFQGRHELIDARTGERRVLFERPALSSAGLPWAGISLEQHADQPLPDADVIVPAHSLCLQLTPGRFELALGDGPSDGGMRFVGGTLVLPAMTRVRIRGESTGELVVLRVDPLWVRAQIEGFADPGRAELIPCLGLEDVLVSATLRALADEARAGCPGGGLYGEALAASMMAHLLRHHSVRPSVSEHRPGGLDPSALRRVVERIDADLPGALSLADLAAVADLSPFHFARIFKRSTGLAPHQFVIRCRVHRARDLLLQGAATVADVAARVGFADQSHLSAHFKRAFGVSPAAFARQTRRR